MNSDDEWLTPQKVKFSKFCKVLLQMLYIVKMLFFMDASTS